MMTQDGQDTPEREDGPDALGPGLAGLPSVAAFSACHALLVSCSCAAGPCRCGSVLE